MRALVKSINDYLFPNLCQCPIRVTFRHGIVAMAFFLYICKKIITNEHSYGAAETISHRDTDI